MTHMAPMSDSQGEFGALKPVEGAARTRCPARCDKPDVHYRIWESHCGGWEDCQYRCLGCGRSWWVDGIDS